MRQGPLGDRVRIDRELGCLVRALTGLGDPIRGQEQAGEMSQRVGAPHGGHVVGSSDRGSCLAQGFA